MSINLTKENARRTQSISPITEGKDDILVSRKTFNEEPVSDVDENLGEEFLIPAAESVVSGESAGSIQASEAGSEQTNEMYRDPNRYAGEPSADTDTKSFETIQKEKSHYIYQLGKFQKKGIQVNRRFSMEHPLEEIRGEYFRIKKENDTDAGVNYCRQGLMFAISTIEMANGKFKIGGRLDGWSQNVMAGIDSYDDVFEELYDKYYSEMKMSPEIKLISMIAGSAFMVHLQNSMSGLGSMPEVQRDMEGPKIDTDELLRELNDEAVSEPGSVMSFADSEFKILDESDVKKVDMSGAKKPRGRPKKNKK